MPVISSCCCWNSLETGSRACAVYTGITGLINFIIDVWVLVNLHRLDDSLEDHEKEIFLPTGIIPFMYIELFFSVGLVILAFVLWIGINYGYDGKKMVFSWVYLVIIIRCYEIFLMIYILVRIGGHRFSDVVYVVPESIVVAVYWLLNTIIMIAALICVISYWEELLDMVHGKERRAKYFTKLSNIRAAAFSASGANTPMRSMYASRAMLGGSQPSIAMTQKSFGPREMPPRHLSQSSYAPSMRSYAPSERSAYTPAPVEPQKGPQRGYQPPGGPPQGPPPQKFFPEKAELPKPAPRQQYQAPPTRLRPPPPQKY